MGLSLKIKLTALITLLVLLMVLATSTLYLSHLTRQALSEVGSRGEYVANEIYHQASTLLSQARMPAGSNPSDFQALRGFVQARLAADAGLTSLLESAIGYSPSIYYAAITDTRHQVMVHNDPGEIGQVMAPAVPFEDLLHAGLLKQLRVIYGPSRVYEVVLPLEIGNTPFGDVRVGVSTLFLGHQITPDLHAALTLSFAIVIFTTLSAGLLSYRLLRPLATISRSVDLLARGEYSEPVRLKRTDEWGVLSSKLNLLGEQMRGEKAAFVQLKENLDQLFSKLSDGLLLFERQDRLVLATPAAARLLGCRAEAIVHRPAREVFSAHNPLHDLLREAFASRQSTPWRTLELGGEPPARVAVNVQFIREQGEAMGCLVTLRDASTRAQIEDQIDVTTKLAALGRITSGVAHEVKNPLNAMVLQLEILKSKLTDQGEKVGPHLEILSTEIRRLDRVVKTFLDFTRPVEIHPIPTSVEGLVREVFLLAEPQALQNNVRLVFEHEGTLPTINVDRDLMKQALLNLVLNGCQAMPSGGQLTVKPQTDGHHLNLEVSDQGVGIPPEARQKIFSLFYTTKPGGSGIGLAMAFRVLQLHNGFIDFTSEAHHGTTFRVSIPVP
ncbi:MAG: ATP-binding protein [Terriglobia bacterium]|jgi:signal transduction histidine kinase/HAMP domain-containing protein